ncbi:MAG: pectin acetylesterase-family hydrolase, partial [Bacteroidales bacterium]
ATAIGFAVFYFTKLSYPELGLNPKEGKWYRVSEKGMKSSEGSFYHALFKKGSSNNVMVYFAGGGVSVNEEMARDTTYFYKVVSPDILANLVMNQGGLASDVEGNPFRDWNLILFPYATGDFHSGTGEFPYVDVNGEQRILYHNGYTNFSLAMKKIMEKAGIAKADTVLVTGFSAGGFATALLSDDIYTNYFPSAKSKNVLVDASLMLFDGWRESAINVWKSPAIVYNQLSTDNLTMDCLRHLRNKYGNSINLFFDCSTRDGDLAKVQNYLQNGVMDVDEAVGDVFQQTLREAIPQFQELGVSLFIFDGVPWYDDPRNLTMHTIEASPLVWAELESTKKSVSSWLWEGMNGHPEDYGLELIDKVYN